ncbi:piggyBac transposable element-derived protein 4 [Trichonephila clavipes]|uniref:PiggyBac transposable element-derived protein 4 n=1 Tax=Trichonephila clavipes TaxID=2585209 RepID=A0A8X6VC66_TRICX|nr:piggyBac transposable element-derived protein 4 [Trichonephila clavipes]
MMQDSERAMIFQIEITKRWILKIGEVMLLYVAYILYCKSGGSRSPKLFKMELIEKIISENHRDEFSATSGRPSISPSPLRLTSRHFRDVILATEKKKSNPTIQCSRKRDSRGKPVRKETRYQCTECQVSLYVVPCFKNYHTKTNV